MDFVSKAMTPAEKAALLDQFAIAAWNRRGGVAYE